MTMVMKVTATSFKARCLALLDEVAESGSEIVVTKRGRPVAKVSAVDDGASLEGSVRFLVDDDALVEPVGADWDADAGS